jgi:hypothetical protein
MVGKPHLEITSRLPVVRPLRRCTILRGHCSQAGWLIILPLLISDCFEHRRVSSIACRYLRCASAEVRLFGRADFAWSKSGNRSTALSLGRVRFEVGFRNIVAVLLNRATMVCLPQSHYGLPVTPPEPRPARPESGVVIAWFRQLSMLLGVCQSTSCTRQALAAH